MNRHAAKGTQRSAVSAETIAKHITAGIIDRRIPPGTKLGEVSLGQVFGVSRTKVRQALFQLAEVKLVKLFPARGAFVAQPSIEEAGQVFEARRMIEGAIVARFIEIAGEKQIAILREHVNSERDAIDAGAVDTRTFLLADFHVLIADMAGNAVLAEVVRELTSRTSLISMLYQSTRAASCSSDEHGELLKAIEKKDIRKAMRLMRDHLDHVEQSLALKPKSSEPIDLRTALLGKRIRKGPISNPRGVARKRAV
jgi:DNA-binding GntR family transcriptional regulator